MATERELLGRITIEAGKLGGKPTIRGRRMAVEQVIGMLAAGETEETLLREYPWMESDDIRACLLYAQKMLASEQMLPEPEETTVS